MIKRLIISGLLLALVGTACTQNPTAVPTVSAAATNTSAAPTATQPAPTLASTETPSTSTQTAEPTASLPTLTPAVGPTQTLAASSPTYTPNPAGKAIIVDHTSIELFDQIPEEYLAKARELRVMYADASVGQNLSDALNCLTATSWAASFPGCRNDYTDKDWHWRTFNQADFSGGRVPERILFSPDPVKYDRSNWVFDTLNGPWNEMTDTFINTVAPAHLDSADVLSFQFNYNNVSDSGGITDPNNGFFVDSPERVDYKDLENYIAQHPDKTFFYWTTSLARLVGTQMASDFNGQMRQYVQDNNLILFDVADIESHTDQGAPCFDARDGVEYCSLRVDGSQVKCENEPDDGQQIPAICQDYTTEPDGGHLGSVSGGGLRLAKGFWVLMARIAGWNP
jgi:hypothetical protein